MQCVTCKALAIFALAKDASWHAPHHQINVLLQTAGPALQRSRGSALFGVVQMVLKCADIGHLAAAPQTHKRWTLLLEEEFYRQVHGVQCSAMLRYAMLCHLRHALPCYAVPCYAMPCHAMLCPAMTCHASCSVSWGSASHIKTRARVRLHRYARYIQVVARQRIHTGNP